MKILIVGDIHWSAYSSIVRSRGDRYSTRLEYLIKSLNWVERVSAEHGCSMEVFLGDTFDKPDLTAEEITALSEVKWNGAAEDRHFIVGNHESGLSSLAYNSTQVLHKVGVVESSPRRLSLDDGADALFLPYITEDDRRPIADYAGEPNGKRLVVFSHNDIKNFQMGPFLSKTGFDIEDIEGCCDLYLNGHLHNGGWVTEKILNVGILSGQNFGEDAFKYGHHVVILDTETMGMEFIENPFALNFYKIDVAESGLSAIGSVKPNAVLAIKCPDRMKDGLIDALGEAEPVAYRITYVKEQSQQSVGDAKALGKGDHLAQFQSYVLTVLGQSEAVREELQEVCG